MAVRSQLSGGGILYNSTGEMPSHSHNASCSTNGNHNHTLGRTSNSDNTGVFPEYINTSHFIAGSGTNLGSTAYAGNHSHTIAITSIGGDAYHENRQPYQVVNRWLRIN